jgi:type III restriction enzyme
VRYSLFDYQDDAVRDVLANLRKASSYWRTEHDITAFSLTATTGAGKTVMAAAVVEALFHGDDDRGFEADPGAVVLWFTDDPSLNEQTKYRLLKASDRLAAGRLKVIDNTFNQDKLEPGNVYFLNSQKLGKNSMLVRGAESPGDSGSSAQLRAPMPDGRSFTIWDTLRNTVEDTQLTLYLVLDEAHRGMKASSRGDRAERQTIVKRLVNGNNGVPAVPIVMGISATVERFNQAMSAAAGRITLPSVIVDPERVQESGLLKDDIRLDFPAESGKFDTVLLRRATAKVREATELWREYANSQDPPLDPVVPLLVVQVPNKPTAELLRSAREAIREEWPDLERDAIAHVFGEHASIDVGGEAVRYVSPERVQDDSGIRVLLAKDAISTGWDCPRAEVLVSFRPAKDQTHITQLLGRMVRTPLARRVPGNDKLNSVECLLPHFDRKTAAGVAEVMLGHGADDVDGSGGSGGGGGRRVLVDPVDMVQNSAIPDAVWDAYARLPSQTLPRAGAKPVKRLLALAQALSRDELRPYARKEALHLLYAELDGQRAKHKQLIEVGSDRIRAVEGETMVAGVGASAIREFEHFTEQADERSVEADFRAAARVFSPDVARGYADRLVDDDDALLDAHVTVAALAKIEGVDERLQAEADKVAREWLDETRVERRGLSDERRAVYVDIQAMSAEPQPMEIERPAVRSEATQRLEKDGNAVDLPRIERHLMSDEEGCFPADLNEWETKVLDAEMRRSGFAAWYRNPSRASADSLAIAYRDGRGNWRRMCPDFLFFHNGSGSVKTSIVDPHGFHLSDALPKLRGLAEYAEEFGDEFHRIDAVAEMKDGTLRVLDLQEERVREAVRGAADAETLYLSKAANDY